MSTMPGMGRSCRIRIWIWLPATAKLSPSGYAGQFYLYLSYFCRIINLVFINNIGYPIIAFKIISVCEGNFFIADLSSYIPVCHTISASLLKYPQKSGNLGTNYTQHLLIKDF
jgi:hypothetical protein